MAKDKENVADMGLQEGKLKALQAAMAKIEKDFGKGSIMKLGDDNIEAVEVISTAASALTPHWAWAVIRAAGLLKYTVLKAAARRRSLYTQ